MSTFKSGDVVWLKNGGPSMTVYSSDGKTVNCDWFDEQNKPNRGVYTTDQLTTEKPSPAD